MQAEFIQLLSLDAVRFAKAHRAQTTSEQMVSAFDFYMIIITIFIKTNNTSVYDANYCKARMHIDRLIRFAGVLVPLPL